MKDKLSKTILKNATASEKAYVIWDADLKGFGLKVTPTGRKVFIYQYRVNGAKKTDRFTFGKYLDRIHHKGKDQLLSLRVAREMAEILRGRIKSGYDPKAECLTSAPMAQI